MAGFSPKTDIRYLIKSSKQSLNRVIHPHARYNNVGRISCIVCGIQMKSEIAWAAHIRSKSHKLNADKASKVAKGDLVTPSITFCKVPKSTEVPPEPIDTSANVLAKDSLNSISTDDFLGTTSEINPAEKKEPSQPPSEIPEGFFDDPYKDAKARKVVYRDKLDDEFDLFQKELIGVSQQSDQLIENDIQNMVSDRDLGEIEDQLTKWSRIRKLEEDNDAYRRKKCEKRRLIESASEKKNPDMKSKYEQIDNYGAEDSDSDDTGLDAEDFNDFRKKSSF